LKKGVLKELLLNPPSIVNESNHLLIETKLSNLYKTYPNDGYIILSLYQFYNEKLKFIQDENEKKKISKEMEDLREKGIKSDTTDEIKS
jgi:hypothetical protein